MRRRRNSYKFTEKTHSKRGIISFSISAVLVLLYVIFVFLAFKGAGTLSTYYGSVGVLAMLVSVVALVISIMSLFEEDSFKIYPRLGFATSLLAVICWLGTYLSGFIL